jgi:hypothetical protein
METFIARQWLGKHVPVATNPHRTTATAGMPVLVRASSNSPHRRGRLSQSESRDRKIWSCVSSGPETKNYSAGKDHQQITRPDHTTPDQRCCMAHTQKDQPLLSFQRMDNVFPDLPNKWLMCGRTSPLCTLKGRNPWVSYLVILSVCGSWIPDGHCASSKGSSSQSAVKWRKVRKNLSGYLFRVVKTVTFWLCLFSQ